MTQRKPPGARWDSWIDQAIQRAQNEGQFDNLRGKGKLNYLLLRNGKAVLKNLICSLLR